MLAPLEVEMMDIDLTEIQSLDPHEIIRYKLNEALKHEQGEFIIEDTSLYFSCFDCKLPGPLIKWFLTTIGAAGMANMVSRMGDSKAHTISVIGYVDKTGNISFFEGRGEGVIVSPRGEKDFGWGPVFQPLGSNKTFGEMERVEKYDVSMRGKAAKKLKEFLLK